MIEPEEITQDSDLHVEASLIGWCITTECAGSLHAIQPGHFYSRPHSDIWTAIMKLRSQGDAITPFTIAPLLSDREVFEMPGGVYKYLSATVAESLLHQFPLRQEKYLIGLAKRRNLRLSCEDAAKGTLDMDGLADAVREAQQTDCAESFSNDYEISERILESLKAALPADSTGIIKLDLAMDGGLHAKKSYGIAARKKMGKTMLAGTISYHLNHAGIKHLFICGEMSPEEIHSRSLARKLDNYSSVFRSEYGKSDTFRTHLAGAIRQSPKNILYRNAPGLTFEEMKNICETAVDIHKVRGIILDYWQLVGGKQPRQSTAEHLDDVAQWLADFCRQRDVWSITMAQINQEGNTRGGEGIRLAFDQVYELKAPGDDPSRTDRWLEMRDTRYTKWLNIGSENMPGLRLAEKGTHFEETA